MNFFKNFILIRNETLRNTIVIVVVLTILIIDIITPLGYAFGILYILPIFLFSDSSIKKSLILTLSITLFIVLGYFLSPPDNDFWKAEVNRSISILVVWVSFLLVLLKQKLDQSLLVIEKKINLLEQKKTNKKFKEVFDSLNDVYMKTKMDDAIEIISPSCFDMLGYSSDELVGEKSSVFYKNIEFRDGMLNEIQQVGYVKDFRATLVCKDGEEITTESNIRLIKDEEGKPHHLVSMIRDISNREQKDVEIINLKIKGEHNKIKSIIIGEEKERKRISQDLHDGVGQLLVALRRSINGLEIGNNADVIKESKNIIDLAISEVKAITYKIQPASLHDFGLRSSLNVLCNLSNNKECIVSFSEIGTYKRLDNNSETFLYRIVQEAINNALRHSFSNKITVTLFNNDNFIELKITDNGKGMNVADSFKNNYGFGLKNMNDRAENIGADLNINSSSNGTIVTVNLILNN